MRPLGGALLLAGGLALAAPAGVARAALTWDVALGGGVAENDNLYLDPETPGEQGLREPVGATVYSASPKAVARWESGPDALRLAYAGDRLWFDGDEERDPLWVHKLEGSLQWRRWEPFYLEVRERRDREPRAQQQERASVFDQIDHNALDGRAGLVWNLAGRGAVEIGWRAELEDYPGVADADRLERQQGEALWRYRWSPLWESELRAAYGEVDRELTSDYVEAVASADVRRRLSERLTLAAGLRWVREEHDAISGAGSEASADAGREVRTSLLKHASLSRGPEGGREWRLAYEERLEGLPEGDELQTRRAVAGASVRSRLGSTLAGRAWYEQRDYRASGREEEAWGPVLKVRWMLAAWLAGDAAGSWTSTTTREQGRAAVEDRSARAGACLVARLQDHLILEGGYQWRRNDSDDALREYESSVVYAALTFNFRPLPPGAVPASQAAALVDAAADEPGRGAAAAGAAVAPGPAAAAGER